MADPLRVLVVDDSASFRAILTSALQQIDDVEIVGTASNGRMALDRLKQGDIDLMTLDIEMPIMNGIETVQELAKQDKTPYTVIISSTSPEQAEKAMKAMTTGAQELLAKPSSSSNKEDFYKSLTNIVTIARLKRNAARLLKHRIDQPAPATKPRTTKSPLTKPKTRSSPAIVEAVAIGSSTGGPAALLEVLSHLPGSFPVPILIVQHLPTGFSEALAKSLNTHCALPVIEAKHLMKIEKGKVYLAPGGQHMTVGKDALEQSIIKLNDGPMVHSVKPAVDILFDSLHKIFHPVNCVVAVLTGMGNDGADGAAKLKDKGSYVLCQDQDSCVVWGMPRAVEERGIADEILSLTDVAPALNRLTGSRF